MCATNLSTQVTELAAERVVKALREGCMPNPADLLALRNCRELLPPDVAQQILDRVEDGVLRSPISYSMMTRIVRLIQWR